MIYEFKPNMAAVFAGKDPINENIAKVLSDNHFELHPSSNSNEGYIACFPGSNDRIATRGIFDFTQDEVDEYLTVVVNHEDTSDPTISELYEWSLKHSMADLPISKVFEIYKMYIR